MVYIIDDRQTGKTSKLVALVLSDHEAGLLVRRSEDARLLEQKYPALKGKVFGIRTLTMRGTWLTRFYIDDIEHCDPISVTYFREAKLLAGFSASGKAAISVDYGEFKNGTKSKAELEAMGLAA